MLQLFDTFCFGITEHLTSLKPVCILMLQGHTETNDWFQMVGRIRGAGESQVCSPFPSNSLFLHSLLYLWLENMPAPSFHPNLFFIPSTCRTFWTTIHLTSQRVFRDMAPCVGHNWDVLPEAGTSNIKFATQDVGISGCGTLKTRLLIYKTKSRNMLLILTLL